MDSFLADGGVSKWASLYPSEDVSRQYTDDDYLGQIFDNTWDSSYSHKQKKAKANSSGSSGIGTGKKLIIPTKLNQETKDTVAKIKPNTYTPEGKKTKEEREKHLSAETAKKESKLKERQAVLKKQKIGEIPPGLSAEQKKNWTDKSQKAHDQKIIKELKDIERQLESIKKMEK